MNPKQPTQLKAIQHLRNLTGLSLAACASALERSAFDVEKAQQLLRAEGQKPISSDSTTGEGVIGCYLHHNKQLGALVELLALPENWNGYGAQVIERPVVPVVLNFLAYVFAEGTPPLPDLVPTIDGGVQLEWHVGGFDLEVEFSPRTGVRAYFCDEAAGEEWEVPALSNPDRLGRALTRLRDQ